MFGSVGCQIKGSNAGIITLEQLYQTASSVEGHRVAGGSDRGAGQVSVDGAAAARSIDKAAGQGTAAWH